MSIAALSAATVAATTSALVSEVSLCCAEIAPCWRKVA